MNVSQYVFSEENDTKIVMEKNTIFLVAKKFIWTTSRQSKILNLENFKIYLKKIYIEREYIVKTNSHACRQI